MLGGGGILDTVVVHSARTVLPRHRHAAVAELTTLQSLNRKQKVTKPSFQDTFVNI